ncbi:hypothetical protein [Methylibium sp.]|uniref:hypothetical protein n=1 Tax=Methylibium sp. TaxID=2067992 RepID=UPI0017EFB2A9|nr:hypothetical protein [Methylibium sp.]MBA3588733.1 hypothetical protein [Methylibium sp.]
MSAYWWIAAALVAACFGVALLSFAYYLWSGADRARDVALAWARWGVVFLLGAVIVVVFKHLILTLLGS